METLSTIPERSATLESHENRKQILFVNWLQVLSVSNGGLGGSLAGTSRGHFKEKRLNLDQTSEHMCTLLFATPFLKRKTNSTYLGVCNLCVSAYSDPFSPSLPLLVPFYTWYNLLTCPIFINIFYFRTFTVFLEILLKQHCAFSISQVCIKNPISIYILPSILMVGKISEFIFRASHITERIANICGCLGNSVSRYY